MARLLAAVVLTAAVLTGAATAASAESREWGTWVGRVERHGAHFDYVGRPCPVEAEVCAAFVARYRIVPLTREARTDLPAAAGGTATLEGFLVPRGDGTHHGLLFVSELRL
ncbi:MAG TPA: hypothetical protein VHF27_05465 [Acidimicrobiales bacterium]|nr:hypothetical protein [Acidimicrobiales bacterium]